MPTSNNSINNTVGNSNPGGSNLLSVINLDNSSTSSTASCNISVGGTSAGPVWTQYTAGISRSWAIGLNTSTQNLEIATNASNAVSPNTGTPVFVGTPTGNVTQPNNATFFAYLSGTQTGVTGTGTIYRVAFDQTPLIQNPGNFSGGTFTAPVAGYYHFTCFITVNGLETPSTIDFTSMTLGLNQNGSGGVYYDFFTANPVLAMGLGEAYGDQFAIGGSALVFMHATDTMNAFVTVNGPQQTINVVGNGTAPYDTYFTGCLVT